MANDFDQELHPGLPRTHIPGFDMEYHHQPRVSKAMRETIGKDRLVAVQGLEARVSAK